MPLANHFIYFSFTKWEDFDGTNPKCGQYMAENSGYGFYCDSMKWAKVNWQIGHWIGRGMSLVYFSVFQFLHMTFTFLVGVPICLIALVLWVGIGAYYWVGPASSLAVGASDPPVAAFLMCLSCATIGSLPFFIFAVMHVLYGFQIALGYIGMGLSAAIGAILGGLLIILVICLFTVAIPLFCPIIALIFAFLTGKTIIIVGGICSLVFPFMYLGYKYNSKKAASGESTGCLS